MKNSLTEIFSDKLRRSTANILSEASFVIHSPMVDEDEREDLLRQAAVLANDLMIANKFTLSNDRENIIQATVAEMKKL